jgi:hypothetical protein
MKRNCTDHPIIPEINSVTTVEEKDRWVCSMAFKDEVNAIVNTCGQNIDELREKQCGDYLIELTSKRRSYTKTIANLPLSSSCTYRIHSKCGYPGFTYNSDMNIDDEFDIAYSHYSGNSIDNDINTWNFNATSTFAGVQTSSKDNKGLHVPGDVDHSMWEDCSF